MGNLGDGETTKNDVLHLFRPFGFIRLMMKLRYTGKS